MRFGQLVFVALCAVPSPAVAQLPLAATVPGAVLSPAQAYRFAGTDWGSSAAQTTEALAARGFRLDKTVEDGDLIFTGTLNDRPAIVIALFGEQGLSKILVSVPTEDGSTLATYREMKTILGAEYGVPAVDVESYAYPFADGKHIGFEAAALRVGKATIAAQWKANGEALGLKITERLIVSAHYESPSWKQESERRVRRVGP
jgi:hypothetical protein